MSGAAAETYPSERQEEDRPGVRDSSACLSQQNTSMREDSGMQHASQSGQLQLHDPTAGTGSGSGDAQQPSTDLCEWDSYVDYINRQVIQGHGDSTAGNPGSQDTQPVWSSRPACSSRVRAERIAKNISKKAQAELEVQLAQVEAAAGTFIKLNLCNLSPLF